MTTLESLKEEMAPYKGTLVLDHFDVVLLKDVIQEPGDFYWVYYAESRGLYYSSCVRGWIPLKGFLPDKEYKNLVGVWNLNHNEENHAI
jgi:hypothetical protein